MKFIDAVVIHSCFAVATGCSETLLHGGCANQQCDVDTNSRSKTCGDDAALCSVVGCEEHCIAGTGLEVPCTHYAFEAMSGHTDEWGNQLGECVVFGDCTNQKEATSTIYALEDWCQKSKADGGCPEIWCDDEGGLPGWTVCDFPKRPDCT